MVHCKHYFPGGNTPAGFFSYYHEILDKDTPGSMAVIKGGPGTGKSTLMKSVGKQLEQNGLETVYLHCSSDPASLDGVFLPKYNTAVVDGTAPHVLDPRHPGGIDLLLNVCDLINAKNICPMEDEIRSISKSISTHFDAGYHYLKAASAIKALMEQKSEACLLPREIHRFVADMVKRLQPYAGKGREKTMFLSAITSDGFRNFAKEALEERFVILLRANPGDSTKNILQPLCSACRLRGIDMEVFCCPMNPSEPEHIVFPSANLAITVSNEYHTMESPDEVLFFSDFTSGEYDNNEEQLCYNNLLYRATEEFGKAKTLHDDLESIYIPSVDFSKMKQLETQTLQFLTKGEL
ncbi:MAG: hypothetical protein IJ278_04945 [Clostridia bacterium]|nr:hypothetical protein [Clostridia bacterium]